MIGQEKTYTRPEEQFVEDVARGFWIGSKFYVRVG